MAARSAGLLLFRRRENSIEVLIAHMGGPLWARKDEHAWSIPKGEYAEGEDPYAAARREFAEELGQQVPDGEPLDLGEIRQASGKRVQAWAVEGDLDTAAVVSNTFSMEWPRGSGRLQEFPEVDRAEWCSLEQARRRLIRGQVELLDRLANALG
jgi:predicted NUDIX family NTP pyrophosphohydrolase